MSLITRLQAIKDRELFKLKKKLILKYTDRFLCHCSSCHAQQQTETSRIQAKMQNFIQQKHRKRKQKTSKSRGREIEFLNKSYGFLLYFFLIRLHWSHSNVSTVSAKTNTNACSDSGCVVCFFFCLSVLFHRFDTITFIRNMQKC